MHLRPSAPQPLLAARPRLAALTPLAMNQAPPAWRSMSSARPGQGGLTPDFEESEHTPLSPLVYVVWQGR